MQSEDAPVLNGKFSYVDLVWCVADTSKGTEEA